ncbi:MAG: hypothetical protein ACI4RA_09185 [Kiritimatiellia bacterium]
MWRLKPGTWAVFILDGSELTRSRRPFSGHENILHWAVKQIPLGSGNNFTGQWNIFYSAVKSLHRAVDGVLRGGGTAETPHDRASIAAVARREFGVGPRAVSTADFSGPIDNAA